jgi:hypothetical protein
MLKWLHNALIFMLHVERRCRGRANSPPAHDR